MDFASNLHFGEDDQVIGVLYLALLKQAFEREGLELKLHTLLERDLNNPKHRISRRTFLKILSDSLDDAPAGIGLRYGRHLNLVAADSLGQLIMSCDTLGEAADELSRFRLLLALPFSFERGLDPAFGPKVGTDQTGFQFRGLYNRALPDKVNWFISEVLFLSIQSQARWLSGQPLNFSAIYLPYAKPPHADLYTQHLECSCFFESDHHAMVFDASYLDRPIVTNNRELKKHKQATCAEALQRWARNFSISQRLRAMFKHDFPQLPCIDKAAARLNMSKSCLHRRLQDEGVTFQSLLNDFKQQRSEYFLKHTNYTMNEIAEKLGFCDGSTFRRAFKNWTGRQPSTVREGRLERTP